MSINIEMIDYLKELKEVFIPGKSVKEIKKKIRSLISHDMTINERRVFNDVLLRSLVKHNDIDLFKSSLNIVGYNLKPYTISSTFLFVVEYRSIEWIEIYMDFYDSTQYIYGDAISVATKSGDIDKVKYFVKKLKAKNINKNKFLSSSLTRYTAELNHVHILKYFVDNGIGSDLKHLSDNVLTYAAKSGSIDVIKYILSIPNIDLSKTRALYASIKALRFSIAKEIFKHPTAKYNNFLYPTFDSLVLYASNKCEDLAIEMYNAIQDKRVIDELNVLLNNAILRRMNKLVNLFLSEKIFLIYLSRLDFSVMNNKIKIALKTKYDLKSDEELYNFLRLL